VGSPLKRVCVLGCAGAGKTYVARQLARLAGLPYVDLDRLFWQPGWRVPEEAAWRAVQRGLVAGSEWVLDGNYASTYDERLPLADTVVVLETPRWRCLARVLVRRVRRRGVEVAPGCPDKLDAGFLAYVWRFPRRARPRLDAALAALGPDVRIVRLRTRRDAAVFLSGLAPAVPESR
jgi:adenylate kinase family enzyme